MMAVRPGQARRFLPALGAAALALAGCGGRDARPARPRILVAAISADPGHLNGAITTGGGVHTAAGLLYDGLVTLDAQLRPRPALAERWEVEDEGRRYRFHLRRDVRWHDGVPLTAADVAFTFREVLLKFHSRTRASLAPALESIATPDALTVEFRMRRPYAPLLQQLDVVEAPILPRHVFEGTDPLRNPANTAPVGTGPFRFLAYAPDAEIRYAANRGYFAGAPAIDEVVLRVIPDRGSQVLALEAGEVDWLFEVPGPDRERLRRNPEVALLETTVNPGGSNCIHTLAFNLDRPMFGDVRVRRALFHAVDRDQVEERVLFGEGRVATAPISSGIPFAHATDLHLPAFDLAEASRLLDEAGWPASPDGRRAARGAPGMADGTALRFDFTAFPSLAAYGDLLRAQLRRVGAEVVLRPLESPVFVDAVFARRDFGVAMIPYCHGTDPEIGVRRQYVSSSIGPVPFSNASGYRNPAMDVLFDRASSLLDPAARGRVYHEIQEAAVRDLPYVWLAETAATRAYRRRCSGFGSAAHFAAAARCPS